MKGLLKYLSPFAPDQSGAVSALYTLNGIIVICDAGGCTGNICGFDEPRWFQERSAVFSAGLRDMDAILGRDDRLVEKLKDAVQYLDKDFAAIIGTPVPAVIATDLRAVKRMAQKRCQLPVLAVECTGTRLYDEGAADAYVELFSTFAQKDVETDEKTIGILGLIPLDVSILDPKAILEPKYKAEGYDQVLCYGMGDNLEAVTVAGTAAKNIVVAPAALSVAKYLEKEFGTPYEVCYPLFDEAFLQKLDEIKEGKVLVVHQQVAANEIRTRLEHRDGVCVTVGNWFMMPKTLKQDADVHFEREDKFIDYVMEGNFDVVIADPAFKRALRDYKGTFVELPHFAVSGSFADDSQNQLWS